MTCRESYIALLQLSYVYNAFYDGKHILNEYDLTGFANTVWSVWYAAVVTVNLIICKYIGSNLCTQM